MSRIASHRCLLSDAVRSCRSHLLTAGCFSASINLLYLTPTIFMLQVYERVVPTGGLGTLLLLGIVCGASLAALSLLEALRSRLLAKTGARLDVTLAPSVLEAAIGARAVSRSDRRQSLRDLGSVRALFSGPAIVALMDAPWTPVYLLVLGLLHPLLAMFTFGVGCCLAGLAMKVERRSRAFQAEQAGDAALLALREALTFDNASDVQAMGLRPGLSAALLDHRAQVVARQHEAFLSTATLVAVSKYLRLTAQSAVLALAAYLVVTGSISGGSIFAASLLLGRTLAPIELLIANWTPIERGRAAYRRLSDLLGEADAVMPLTLPEPRGEIDVEQLTVRSAAGSTVLGDISFRIGAGEIIALVGASGAGKSTLIRALAGAIPADEGVVRIDGAALSDWPENQLVGFLGYLPQNVALFPGSVKENIAAFAYNQAAAHLSLDEQVVKAAKRVGAHEMILRLPQGYDTNLADATGLSGGQAQRIALARAIMGARRIVLLDEPTAHLDSDARRAFISLLKEFGDAGVTTVIATHDPDVVHTADKVMVLAAGRVARYGSINKSMPLQARG